MSIEHKIPVPVGKTIITYLGRWAYIEAICGTSTKAWVTIVYIDSGKIAFIEANHFERAAIAKAVQP